MKKYLSLFVVLIFLGGCSVSKAPVTNRTQLILIPMSQELALGEESFKTTLKDMKLSNDKELSKKVESIGEAIAAVAQQDSFKWECTCGK